jgi:hypothetical protein
VNSGANSGTTGVSRDGQAASATGPGMIAMNEVERLGRGVRGRYNVREFEAYVILM